MKYDDLVQTVDEANELGSIDDIYFDSISKLRSVQEDMGRLDDTKHLARIIKQFLVKWGGLGRVVGRKTLSWSLLGRTLRSLRGEFEVIRGSRFPTIDFRDGTSSNAIRTIYETLDPLPYLGSPTTISKTLHLLNPEIFVMWDIRIRKMSKARNSRVRETADGYLEFLTDVQSDIKEVLSDRARSAGMTRNEVEKQIRRRYKGKTLAKIADEYNWVKSHSHNSR